MFGTWPNITPHVYEFTPLWFNKLLLELLTVPEAKLWALKGIYLLYHLQPNNMQFHYFQLRHRLRTQFSTSNPVPFSVPILEVIYNVLIYVWYLVSIFYMNWWTINYHVVEQLGLSTQIMVGSECWRFGWGKGWKEMLETCKLVFPKQSNRLIQIYILQDPIWHQSCYLDP